MKAVKTKKGYVELRGHSDDIIAFNDEDEIDPVWAYEESFSVSKFLLTWRGGRALVVAVYAGCWSFAVSKVDEDDSDLPTITRSWDGYSEVIRFHGIKGGSLCQQ